MARFIAPHKAFYDLVRIEIKRQARRVAIRDLDKIALIFDIHENTRVIMRILGDIVSQILKDPHRFIRIQIKKDRMIRMLEHDRDVLLLQCVDMFGIDLFDQTRNIDRLFFQFDIA